MKIAITGHTKGIGKGLFDYLVSNNHEVIGFSRSNGFDIAIDKDKIIEQSKDCDMFINNAQSKNHQTVLFNNIFKLWQNERKTIVNIGSKVKYQMHNNTSERSSYGQAKINLAHSVYAKILDGRRQCRVISIDPGLVDTDFSKNTESLGLNTKNMPALTVDEVVKIASYILELPFYIEVGEISFWRRF